jgi:HSP20 family protein
MSLIRYTPRTFAPWQDLDRWVDTFFAPTRRQAAGQTWAPAVDVLEDEKAIVIKADLPEVDEKDIKLELNDGILTLKGERKIEKERKEEDYHFIERSYGAFSRSFRLPDTVNADEIKAAYKKGVLEVTLPKREPEKKKVRTISVN